MGTRNVTMRVTDQFFPAAQLIPDPLPNISNKCTKPYDCTLNATTVTELIYASKQVADIASDPQGAIEMRTKLSSRQKVLLAATGVKEDFNKVDAGNLCGEINAEVLNWALSKAPKNSLDRYYEIGRQLRIGADRDMSNLGPLWIWTSIVSYLKVFLSLEILKMCLNKFLFPSLIVIKLIVQLTLNIQRL